MDADLSALDQRGKFMASDLVSIVYCSISEIKGTDTDIVAI